MFQLGFDIFPFGIISIANGFSGHTSAHLPHPMHLSLISAGLGAIIPLKKLVTFGFIK